MPILAASVPKQGTGLSLGTILASTVIAGVVSAVVTQLLTRWNNRDNRRQDYILEQKKQLRELIGRYRGRMLEAAVDWDRRMGQLYQARSYNNLRPCKDRRHSHKEYLYHSVVFRFLSLMGIARKFESESFFIDSSLADGKELEFLRYAKGFLWVMTHSELTPDDGLPGMDHFRNDEFRPLLDMCYERGKNIPENKIEGEVLFDWRRYRALIDQSGKEETAREEREGKENAGDALEGDSDARGERVINVNNELDEDTQAEIERVLIFFDGIRPDEYGFIHARLAKRRRWERIICLHLLVLCFISTFGYPWQQDIENSLGCAINMLKGDQATLRAFLKDLKLIGLDDQEQIAKLRAALEVASLSSPPHSKTRSSSGTKTPGPSPGPTAD